MVQEENKWGGGKREGEWSVWMVHNWKRKRLELPGAFKRVRGIFVRSGLYEVQEARAVELGKSVCIQLDQI